MNSTQIHSRHDLQFFVDALKQGKWIILLSTFLLMCVSVFYLFITQPVYRSNVILQLENQGASLNGLEEISELLFSESASALAEIEIIRSRTMIQKVIQELQLDSIALPDYFPLIGKRLAQWQSSSESPWGFGRYAWSDEFIHIKYLDVHLEHLNSPFELIYLGHDEFEIYDEDGKEIATGFAGRLIEDHPIFSKLLIEHIQAPAGTRFNLTKQSLAVATAELQKRLQVSEKTSQTGIIQINLEGTDNQQNALILNTLANTYIQANINRKLQEVDGMLDFVNQQLPSLKENLDQAESKLSHYHQEFGAVDIDVETKSILGKIAEIEKQQSALELIRLDYVKKYTGSHPELVSLRQKISKLGKEKDKLNDRLQELPAAQRQAIHIMRDVETAQAVYSLLLTKSQELSIAKAGVTGNIHMVDAALPAIKPFKPQGALTLILGILFGFIAGSIYALWRKSLQNTIDHAYQLEQAFDLPVLSIIPHSPKQKSMNRKGQQHLLAQISGHDPSIEGLRTLRSTLEFSHSNNKSPFIVVSGPSPNVGKSFISANLLPLIAGIGKKVLLIDADLRKGVLHQSLNQPVSPGLSDILFNHVESTEAIKTLELLDNQQMYFLSRGQTPANPSELLMTKAFQDLMDNLSQSFDLIIIDTPPIGLLTDPAVIASQVQGVNLLVARAGEHQADDIDLAIQRFSQVGSQIDGIVFNDVQRTGSYGYYDYYGYSSNKS